MKVCLWSRNPDSLSRIDRVVVVTDIKVAVIGANGRMGSEAVKAVGAAEGLRLVGAYGSRDELGDLGGADVAVELTVPAASPDNVAHCVERGVHVVVGTTGWDEARLETLRASSTGRRPPRTGSGRRRAHRAELRDRGPAHDVVRRQGGPLLRVRRGHRAAPPGQGRRTRPARPHARRRSSARRATRPACPRSPTRPPTTLTAPAEPSVERHTRALGEAAWARRAPGGPPRQRGEQLTIRHDSFDRASFMPGVMAAVRAVADHPGLTVGLEKYLGLD